MAVTARLQHHLDRQGVSYAVLSHREAFTAQDAAAAAHVSAWRGRRCSWAGTRAGS